MRISGDTGTRVGNPGCAQSSLKVYARSSSAGRARSCAGVRIPPSGLIFSGFVQVLVADERKGHQGEGPGDACRMTG